MMRLRPFLPCRDLDAIRGWIPDERAHALWCAGRIRYPIERESFDQAMLTEAMRFSGSPYVATTDDGNVIGFFCYSLNVDTNEGMLKFVMLDPAQRGKGLGREMVRLAVRYAFDITGADAVQLNVFSENERALRCYESVGFEVRRAEEKAFTFREETWGRYNMVLRGGRRVESKGWRVKGGE